MVEKYQLVFLGSSSPNQNKALTDALETSLETLGLVSSDVLSITKSTQCLDERYPIVGIWWGTSHSKSEDIADLQWLLGRGCGVLPVVEDLTKFSELVPETLQSINGHLWLEDPTKLATEILRMFGLTRRQRSAFISYRRTDSRGVATQLLHCLSDHGYRAFLDTASVDSGVSFQDELWDALADVDLMLFIDTPNALSSSWVEAELTRAHQLGLGILQLVWPSWKPFQGTDLCNQLPLRTSDFLANASPIKPDGKPNAEGKLEASSLEAVMRTAEKVRMRSLGSRRTRLTGEIVASATRCGLQATPGPSGLVTFSNSSGGRAGQAMPVMGLPGAETVYELESSKPSNQPVRVVYDGLGIHTQRRGFLDWLNRQVPGVQTQTVDSIDSWVKGL